MQRLFEYANVRRLGDLDGKRLSDFAGYRGCTKMALWELRRLLLRVLHPGVEPDSTTWPILMSDYRPPGPVFRVPPAIYCLSPQDLPVSTRLANVLRCLGIERLAQLHEVPIRKLLMTQNCGRHTLDELGTLLRRAEAGSSDCPEKGNRRLRPTSLRPITFSIPEYLRATPVGGPGLSERLRNLLRYAGIRLLGDLDGKRLSNFEPYRGCGQGTLWEVRCMIFKALHPGVKPDLSTRPIPMRYWRPSKPTIEVVRAAEDLRPKDLPVSVRLEGVLQGLGIERLGQLHGLPVHKLLVRPNCGRKTIAELRTLLLRAEAGEFALSQEEIASSTPADLLRHIDNLVSRLPEQKRAFLLLRFGGTGHEPQTFREIGQQHGLTGSAVGLGLSSAIRSMRREGSPRLRTMLEWVDSVCASRHTLLNSSLVSAWQDSTRPFRYNPGFYVRLIANLRCELGVAGTQRDAPAQSGVEGA